MNDETNKNAGRYLTFCGGSKVLFFVFFSHVAQSDGSVMAFLRNDKLLHDEFDSEFCLGGRRAPRGIVCSLGDNGDELREMNCYQCAGSHKIRSEKCMGRADEEWKRSLKPFLGFTLLLSGAYSAVVQFYEVIIIKAATWKEIDSW